MPRGRIGGGSELPSSHKKQNETTTTIMAHLFTTSHCPIRYGDDKPPVPDNLPVGQQGAFLRSSDDRLWLFQRQWIPAGEIIATLMILHGTVDHSGVYHELAIKLNKVGIAVFAADMRGWGLSDGESYYFHDMETFVSDVEMQYTRIQQCYPQVKYHFLLGKSIGGLLAAYTCCSPNVHLNGLIGLSGAFALDQVMIPPAPIMALLYSLNLFMPKLPLKPLMDSSMLVSDETAQEKWKADTLVRHDEKLTVGYLQELLHCTRILEHTLKEKFPTDMPVLMLWGTDDKVVTHAGHALMCSVSDNASLKTYPGGRHNLLAEPSWKEQVITDICDWILLNCKKEEE